MLARRDPLQWLIIGACASMAMLLGLIAGIAPGASVGLSFAVAYGLLAFANLPVALALYCCEPFGYSFEESAIARIAVVVLLVSWLGVLVADGSKARKLFVDHPGLTSALLLLIAWSLLSVVWAENPGRTLIATGRYASGVAVMFIAYSVVRGRAQAILLSAAIVVGAVAAAMYGLAFGVYDDGRLSALSLDPNELATVLVPAVALAIALLVPTRRSPLLRIALIGAAAFCVMGVFMTASREGLIALLVVFALGLVVGGRWRGGIALAGTIAILFGTLYLFAFASSSNRDRIVHAVDQKQRREEGRTALWTVGWRIFDAHPLNGVGAGNFQDSARHYVLQPGHLDVTREIIDTPKVSHSTYVELLTGLGIPGLALFLIADVIVLVCCGRAIREFKLTDDIDGEALARGLLVALIGVQVTHVFHSDEGNKQLWLLFGLGPTMLAIARAQRAGASADAEA